MTLPNFLIIGAAKAGTSSLERYLRQHPQIAFNNTWKELRFFAYDGAPPAYAGPGDVESNRYTMATLDAYRACFASAAGTRAIGEVSPVYLYSERAPERIARYIPDVRLIAILRNPIERAYSHYMHLVRDDREREWTFADALAREDERVRMNWEWSWHYRRVGLYHRQLERYYARFDRSQIRIFLYDDFETDPLGLLREVFRLLDVDDTFVPDTSKRYNVSGVPRSRLLSRTLKRTSRTMKRLLTPADPYIPRPLLTRGRDAFRTLHRANIARPALDQEVRRDLISFYRDEIGRLEVLLGRDLSHWLASRSDR